MIGAMHTRMSILALALCSAGCQQLPLTRGEAESAMEQSQITAQASALTAATIELHTDVTIGDRLADAAQHLGELVQSQLPCAEVSLTDNLLSIEYGQREGDCTYRGHSLSGIHRVEVVESDSQVVLEHHWEALSNGVVAVSGAATVTWDAKERERRVEHAVSFMRLSDGLSGTATGSRTQRPLPGGISEGFVVDGERSWHGAEGEWSLDIRDVEMRWADPVPQAGAYELSTPFDKAVTLGFMRVDETHIEVTVEGPRREFSFTVSRED